MLHELLNTLYVQRQGAYLRLDHETLRVDADGEEILHVPLHHLGSLAVFGNVLVSPFLLHKCASDQRSVIWFGTNGRFQGRLVGPTSGNVLLRKAQFEANADNPRTLALARGFLSGKFHNGRILIQRAVRDTPERWPDGPAILERWKTYEALLFETDTLDALRGVEGNAAAAYFDCFANHIRQPDFPFGGRVRRPPRDPVNAMLSFAYTLLANECASALEGVGLDPQVGFLHTLRPGRPALALDLMEELRHPVADRHVLALINRNQISIDDFTLHEGGGCTLTESGRRTFLKEWQARKQETVEHKLLQRSIPWGLVPHIQARLLARTLRGDLDAYPPFLVR